MTAVAVVRGPNGKEHISTKVFWCFLKLIIVAFVLPVCSKYSPLVLPYLLFVISFSHCILRIVAAPYKVTAFSSVRNHKTSTTPLILAGNKENKIMRRKAFQKTTAKVCAPCIQFASLQHLIQPFAVGLVHFPIPF